MTQPEALRLAEQLEDTESAKLHLLPYVAAELRRLHATVQAREDEIQTHSAAVYEATKLLSEMREQRDALLEALKVVLDDLMYRDHARVIDVARAAIAKAEGA